MGFRTRAMAIAIVLGFALPGVVLADEPAKQLVVLGLRPTDTAGGATEIRRLAEAQQRRSLVESLIQLVSGHTVVGHDQLGKLLRNSYMVELFDCGERLECVQARVKKLVAAGYRTAVYGSYWVDGETNHFQIFTFSLTDGKVVKRVEFELGAAQLEDTEAWRAKLDPLFTNRGRVTLTSNVIGYQCTVDGAPCNFDPDGRTLVLSPGEHAFELRKQGYKSSGRVVTIAEGEQQQIAFVLDEIPIAAPAPANPEEPSANTKPGVTPIVGIAFGAAVEHYNVKDAIDNPAPPPGTPKLWHVAMFNTTSYLGATFKDVKRGDWQSSAFATVGLYGKHQLRMPNLRATFANEDAGVTFQIGRTFSPTVATTQPGMLVQTGQRFGQLNYAFNGAKVTKSFGRNVVTDFGVGRAENYTEGEQVSQGFNSYDVEGRIAYLNPKIAGSLYSRKVLLTVAVSGAFGLQRAGEDEIVPMGSATPVEENLQIWVGAGELILPLGPFVLTGAGYVGRAAGYFGGAQFQRDRVDPMTGNHGRPFSMGAWGQVSLPFKGIEISAIAGEDWVYRGLGFGIDAHGSSPDIELNRVGAGVFTYELTKQLRLGEQVEYVRTRYTTGTTANVVAVTFVWFHI